MRKSRMNTNYVIQASGIGLHILHAFLVKFAYKLVSSYLHFRDEMIEVE